MLAVRAKSDGMEIELTEPIIYGTNLSVEDFEVQQYHYVATKAYGGPKWMYRDLKLLRLIYRKIAGKYLWKLRVLKKAK